MAAMTLHDPIVAIKGVGPELARKFEQLGVTTIDELIRYFPRRYDDYSVITPIIKLRPGAVCIRGTIIQAKGRYVRRGLHITEAIVSDATGSVRLVWFNQPYRAASVKKDADYFIAGVFELSNSRLAVMNPNMELVSDFPVSTARIIPVYRETKGLKSSQIRRVLRTVFDHIRQLPEHLPEWLLSKHGLIPRSEALTTMHFPNSMADLEAARLRLGFEEVFCLSLASMLNRQANEHETAMVIPFQEKLARDFVGHLPFQLTPDQKQVIWRLYQDMGHTQPMNRLVEGDVGSGKTVVATMAALMVIAQGYQVALMAPTELLARQHAETIYRLLAPLGFAEQVGLLVGSLKTAQKLEMLARIASGDVRFMVGTQALIQTKVHIERLGLVILDEQHRFGVDQRQTLQAKAGHALHVLSLTATPIPRSLALTLYGELDISVISQKPGGRKPIITKISSPNSRPALYKKIESQLAEGRQVFVVAPQISESEVSSAAAVEKVHKDIKQVFPKWRVGLLHGKLPKDEKTAVMKGFVAQELDILVSTTVIEVGVDVPNATVMLIEDAERFGLAQIHQLRGRVGRSEHQGYCYLMKSDSTAPSRRLRALESSTDGFMLAELDLDIRGPGAIYGSMQHGQLDLRVAKLTDVRLIAAARAGARNFLEREQNLLHYKELAETVRRLRAITNLN